jgi:acetoin utilization deacetylase AcuC-like enzyme
LKVFYHPDCDLDFKKFGIDIPIVDDRAKLVFDELKKHDPTFHYFSPERLPVITRQDLERIHHKDYLDKLFGTDEQLSEAIKVCYEYTDLSLATYPLSNIRDIILRQVAMFYTASVSALGTGFSYFLGGGMHHAMSFAGRGFCLVNDIVIVLRRLQTEKLIKHAWVIDLDAHKGDGTAELTSHDSSISTFSIHMKAGWPLNQGEPRDPWFVASDMDIAIAESEERLYLEKLDQGLIDFETKYPRPDLVIVVNGADPYVEDILPSTSLLKLSKEQMLARDILVYEFFKNKNIPMSYCMAGGYGKKSWEIYYQFLHFVWQNSSERTEISSG